MSNYEELIRPEFEVQCKKLGRGIERGVHSGEYASLPTYDAWEALKSATSPLLAALEEKDARTAACVNAFEGIETERIAGKNLGEFLAGEVRLNKAEPKPDGSFGFTFSGFAVQIMAEAFADQFKSSGAVNYLELLFEHKEIGPLTVTMQRVEGLTPSQKLAAAEQREGHLKASVDVLSAKNAELQQRLQQPIKLPPLMPENIFGGTPQAHMVANTHNNAITACSMSIRDTGFKSECTVWDAAKVEGE